MCCVLLGTCDGGIFTYEKTTGHFLRTAQQDPLDLQGQKMPGITVRCSNACSDLGSECPAFTVDYSGQRCFKLDRYGLVQLGTFERLGSLFTELYLAAHGI